MQRFALDFARCSSCGHGMARCWLTTITSQGSNMALLGLSSSLGHGGSAVNGGLQLSAIRRSRVLAPDNPHLVSISPFSTATSPWAYHQPCSQELVPSLAWSRIELTKTLVGSALSRLPTQQIRPPGRQDIRNALPRLQPLLSSSYTPSSFVQRLALSI
jgi:hypothetical protein